MVDLAARARNFQAGTKKLFDAGPVAGDMWFFELYHFLGDVAVELERRKTLDDFTSDEIRIR